MVLGGGGGGSIHPQVLLKNAFLTHCLLFGNTKDCCYNQVVASKSFYGMETL